MRYRMFFSYCNVCGRRTMIEMNDDCPQGFCRECGESDYEGVPIIHPAGDGPKEQKERRIEEVMDMTVHDRRE